MRRRGIALAVAVAGAGLAGAWPSHIEPALSAWTAKEPRPLLGVVGQWRDAKLVRVDPRSLLPLRGPDLDVFTVVGPWAFSPDRSQLALGAGCQAGVALGTLQLVDVRRVREVACFAIDYALVVTWPTPSRLLVVANAPLEVLLVDPRSRRIINRTPVEGFGLAAAARAGDRLVALTGSLRGPQRLVVADARGSVRSVGIEAPRASGLVVDASGRRAYVVSGDTVVVADLDTLAVADVRRSPPQPRQRRVSRETRSALWVRRGLIASFGSDTTIAGRRVKDVPIGLRLIDIRRRTARMIDENVTSASLAGEVLLATGADKIGLVAYDSRGRKRFQLFRGRAVGLVETFGGKAYVQVAGKAALQVVDVATGRVVAARRAPLPLLLFKR
jgi:hypothetical protein